MTPVTDERKEILRQRVRFLVQLEKGLEKPMIVLSLVWVVLLILELTRGLSPRLTLTVTVIWIIFIADFLLKLAVAPRRLDFIRRNWLTILSLALPALRLVRIVRFARVLRAARAARGIRFAKMLASINRGMRAWRRAMRRRHLGYVAGLTVIVTFVGAAGMLTFEKEGSNSPAFDTYAESLWWTAMLITSLGSEFWPRTPAGRILGFILGVYGVAIFGYFTASLASIFLDRDQGERRARERQVAAPRAEGNPSA